MDGDRVDPNENYEVKGQVIPNGERTLTPDLSEVSTMSADTTIQERQERDEKEADHSKSDFFASVSPSQNDPILSDEDDSENKNKLVRPNMHEVVSDTEISEILQDNTSDKDIPDDYTSDIKDTSGDKLESISDDNELDLSTDHYMEFPVTNANKSMDTDDIITAVYDDASIISDIFEPNIAKKEKVPSKAVTSRYDDLRSRYTRPRPPPNRSGDPELIYLPARGVRSYAPFLKTFPHSDYTLEDDSLTVRHYLLL